MITCINCGFEIDGRTDDNYNSSHDEIQCPECEKWQNCQIFGLHSIMDNLRRE